FLESLGHVALIGGAIRDVARAGKRSFSSDLDFVIFRSNREEFRSRLDACRAVPNRFGGYRLDEFRLKVDVWHIEDTWARTAGLVRVDEPADLLKCTFFDWDSTIYDLHAGKLVLSDGYLDRLSRNVMDICLEEN